eukprot:gene8165-biopygen1520
MNGRVLCGLKVGMPRQGLAETKVKGAVAEMIIATCLQLKPAQRVGCERLQSDNWCIQHASPWHRRLIAAASLSADPLHTMVR